MGRLLYMIPFIGIIVSIHFIFTFNLASAFLIAGLALTQSMICLSYIIWNIALAGIDGLLEIEVRLWDALVPIIFLMIAATSYLLVITHTININLTGL
tara:strand:- start:79 stop:372 length:294 start_codon:yes stop_codon:yes gene_type:complete